MRRVCTFLAVVLAAAALGQVPPKSTDKKPLTGSSEPITLKHVFVPGEKLRYHTIQKILGERQVPGSETMFPFRETVDKTVAIETLSKTPDGTADLRVGMLYKHTASSFGDKKDEVREVQEHVSLVMSPLNIIVAVREREREATATRMAGYREAAEAMRQDVAEESMFQLVSLSRLLDFGPRFPANPVKVGDTWNQEIAYVPGKVTADEGADKPGMNRVELIYTLDSVKKEAGREVFVIKATFDTKIDGKSFYTRTRRDKETIKDYIATVKGTVFYTCDKATGKLLKLTGSSHAKMDRTFLIPDPSSTSGKYELKLGAEVDTSATSTLVSDSVKPKR